MNNTLILAFQAKINALAAIPTWQKIFTFFRVWLFTFISQYLIDWIVAGDAFEWTSKAIASGVAGALVIAYRTVFTKEEDAVQRDVKESKARDARTEQRLTAIRKENESGFFTITPIVVFVLAIAFAIALVGCSTSDEKGLGDAPVGNRHERPRQIWVSPDTFMNVGGFCIGVNGVYIHTRQAAPVVIVRDPNCAEGGILTQ